MGVDEGLHLGGSGDVEGGNTIEEGLGNLQTLETERKQLNDDWGQAKKEQQGSKQEGMVFKQKP